LGKGKLFWFFSVGFELWQKTNVLDRALAFFSMPHNGLAMRSAGLKSDNFQSGTDGRQNFAFVF